MIMCEAQLLTNIALQTGSMLTLALPGELLSCNVESACSLSVMCLHEQEHHKHCLSYFLCVCKLYMLHCSFLCLILPSLHASLPTRGCVTLSRPCSTPHNEAHHDSRGHMLHLFPETSTRMEARDLTGCINYDRMQVPKISRKRV